MEQSLRQTTGLSLQQQQKITPQMQQSLQLLQAPTFELQQLVQQEMLENPVLDLESQDISLEEQGLDNDGLDRELEELAQLDEEWRELYAQSHRASQRTSEDEERHAFMLDSLTVPETLQEHLLHQLGTSDADESTRRAAELLIGMIDERGFLQSPVDEISLDDGIPIGPLETARDLIHSFHPVGVGATDLRECLLIQLQRLGKEHSLEARIAGKHLADLAMKRYALIARKLGVSQEQVARAADFIATLNPHPGLAFSSDANIYVTPDVIVEKVRGDYIVRLSRDNVPQLRISNSYKDLIARAGTKADVRKYVRDKIRSGKFFIRSIHQRQETIERIAMEIVRLQKDFLDDGPSQLRPLKMAQVADAVGVHETTVSRAVSGKYVATPQGTFEMKYFFTTGFETQSGEALSNTSVKSALLELVKNEPPGKPYSDEKIVNLLDEQGISIARRTVAKYRKELNILPSNMRRRM